MRNIKATINDKTPRTIALSTSSLGMESIDARTNAPIINFFPHFITKKNSILYIPMPKNIKLPMNKKIFSA